MRLLTAASAFILSTIMSPVAAGQTFEALAAQDQRLARIADAMLVANAPLCRNTMPVTGLILHSADQYGEAPGQAFTNGPLAVAGVVPGSAAARAGVRAGDAIVSISGTDVASLTPEDDEHLREAAFFHLARTNPAHPLQIAIRRGAERQTITLDVKKGCLSLVEILAGDGPRALSNGRIIQLRYDFAARLDDTEIAALLAHELAHSVLEHRRRKVEAGIDNGSVMRHFGRNQQVNRQAEVEADRLSVHLLANAGHDPAALATFLRTPLGIEAGGGLMPSAIYPSQGARARLIEREVEMYLPQRRGPSLPGHLLVFRDRSFDEDQS